MDQDLESPESCGLLDLESEFFPELHFYECRFTKWSVVEDFDQWIGFAPGKRQGLANQPFEHPATSELNRIDENAKRAAWCLRGMAEVPDWKLELEVVFPAGLRAHDFYGPQSSGSTDLRVCSRCHHEQQQENEPTCGYVRDADDASWDPSRIPREPAAIQYLAPLAHL
jgi:hypothetical protein